MKLYYFPHTCALGIHILLEEICAPFELKKVDLTKRDQYGPEFTAINAKSVVPVLERDDGSILTEFSAIAVYLGMAYPQARLLPYDPEGHARALEALAYIVSTIHMRGFTRIFRPETFSPAPADKERVQQEGRDMVIKGFDILKPLLGTKDYFLGQFSIVDAALFYIESWAIDRAGIELPPAFGDHFQRMRARPAVRRALAAEGLM